MAEFAKRPEITTTTMGKVHNPSGEGVNAISSQAQAKAAKHSAKNKGGSATTTNSDGGTNNTTTNLHDTKTKEGTARRNITRKKTSDATNYNSVHKKQGGHGKGQWRNDTLEAHEIMNDKEMLLVVDEKDPLYDEAEDLNKYILSSGVVAVDDPIIANNNNNPANHNNNISNNDSSATANGKRGYDMHITQKAVYGPLLTDQEFKARVGEALKEYFDSCDADEFIRSVEELGCQEYHTMMVKKVVSVAMDKGSRERELTSRLLTCLHPYPLSLEHMERGFDLLLDSLDDLSCDVPEAKTMAASFLARAVVDEVVPPAYLSEQNNERMGDLVIEKAVALLSREHCTARLEHVWGPGDGRDVSGLKKEMEILLKEYLASRELDEAARCVKELQAPHFHHELVKRGAFCAMEMDGKDIVINNNNNNNSNSEEDAKVAVAVSVAGNNSNLDAMAALLGFLVRNAIVSEFQVQKGLSRLHQILPDMTLDVPKAPELLQAFEEFCREQDCLPDDKTASNRAPVAAAAATPGSGSEE